MAVFTLAFGGPDAAWMYACSCCSVQCKGTGWVAGQPMLKRLSSCKMQRVRIVASSMSPSDGLTRCALQLYESWSLLASSLHDWSRKILETNPSRPRPTMPRPRPRPRPAVSIPRPRPRPPKNGLEWSRDQDRGLEDYITDENTAQEIRRKGKWQGTSGEWQSQRWNQLSHAHCNTASASSVYYRTLVEQQIAFRDTRRPSLQDTIQ